MPDDEVRTRIARANQCERLVDGVLIAVRGLTIGEPQYFTGLLRQNTAMPDRFDVILEIYLSRDSLFDRTFDRLA
jgi:hypothetical protein